MFSKDKFRQSLLAIELSVKNIGIICYGREKFLQLCASVLDNFASRRKKYSRGNNMLFINKPLKSTQMKRSRLRNRYLKTRSEFNKNVYNKQRNYRLSLLWKTKKAYYANLNEKDVTDNKQFWKTVKPMFSDKIRSCDKITLIDGEKIVKQDDENAEILNSFFSSAMKNLEEVDPLADQISHPILKARVKYRNHPSVIAIGNADNGSHFHFSCVSTNDVLKEIKKSLHKK